MLHKIRNHKATRITTRIISIKLKILLFIVLSFVLVTFLTSQTDFVRGYKSYIVVSGSMEPSIPVGSIVYSQKASDYQKGDVISFKNAKGQTITHRIVEVTKRNNIVSFKTKGDANNTADAELVQVGNVVGRTIFTVPYVGKIVSFIKTPLGFGLIIILPTLLFILGEFWNIKKEIEKEVEKKIMAKLEKANT